ncbi:hypothetical protein V8D89_012645 [Ganoderma adspersum]
MYVHVMSFSLDSRHCIRDSTTSVSIWLHTFIMVGYTAFPLLQRLESTLVMSPPYCSGILEAPHEAFKLYYGQKNARFIDLLDPEASTATDQGDALEALANACERAKFGRGEETVLDETYRKAGKMDSDNFMTGLDPEATGLCDAVRLGLLSAQDETRAVRAELYKLNVYGERGSYPGHHVEWSWLTPTGEGAFFKPHKDTPRGQSMFGSLVVVFPTPHEGGALVLRHEDEEFTFDAAALLSGRTSSIAYVAFFSDVEHEVLPVLSGHRVTLTYNLFFGKPAPSSSLEVLRPLHTNASAVKDALAALLDDAKFMPRGGTLGFGLRHHYPFPKAWTRRMESPLKSLRAWLKGGDAALFAACAELGVEPLLRLVCKGDRFEDAIVLERMEELGEYVVSAEETLLMRGGERVHGYTFTGDAGHPWESEYAGFSDEEGGRMTRTDSRSIGSRRLVRKTGRDLLMLRMGMRRLWIGCIRGFVFLWRLGRTGIGLGKVTHQKNRDRDGQQCEDAPEY